MKNILGIVLLAGILTACQTVKPIAERQVDCRAKGVEFVVAGPECLNVKRVSYGKRNGKVLVFLHGYSNGPSWIFRTYGDLFDDMAKAFGGTAYLIASPGYGDSSSYAFSQTKKNLNRHKPAYVQVYAEALKEIAKREQASEIYLAGQSNGAMTSANVIGQHPNLVKRAVLLSGAYDLNGWYASRGWPTVVDAVSPIDVISDIQETDILVVAGEDDTRAHTRFSVEYAEKLQQSGKKHKLVLVSDMGHSFNDNARAKFMPEVSAFLSQ